MQFDKEAILKYNELYKSILKDFGNQSYSYDNQICCCFAHLIGNKLEDKGIKPFKVLAMASEREDDAQEKGVGTFLRESGKNDFNKVSWDYHIAAAFYAPIHKDSQKTTLLVCDPVIFGDNIVTVDQWRAALAVPDYAFAMAPKGEKMHASPTGFWLDENEPSNLDGYSKAKVVNLNKEAEKGRLTKFEPLASVLMRSVNSKNLAMLRARGQNG